MTTDRTLNVWLDMEWKLTSVNAAVSGQVYEEWAPVLLKSQHCLKQWIYTSVSAAMAIQLSYDNHHQLLSLLARQRCWSDAESKGASHTASQPFSFPTLLSRGCLSQMGKNKIIIFLPRSHPAGNELVFGARQTVAAELHAGACPPKARPGSRGHGEGNCRHLCLEIKNPFFH